MPSPFTGTLPKFQSFHLPYDKYVRERARNVPGRIFITAKATTAQAIARQTVERIAPLARTERHFDEASKSFVDTAMIDSAAMARQMIQKMGVRHSANLGKSAREMIERGENLV